ncbi:MAG: hypothetical protein IJ419_01440 [Agathobacter sp.]|nr:hypothetical protein [Agathobacter sp.]
MADVKKRGFKTVETNYEEVESQIRQHRKVIIRRVIEVVAIVVVLVVAIELLYALRSFDSYEIRNSVERSNTDVTQFAEYNRYILEYSNDGISCVTHNREMIWNQSYEMSNPQIDVCGKYLVVYDSGGSDIYILAENGLQSHVETTLPIQTVCVAEQGTIAVLMRNGAEAQVKLFGKEGNELANGKFYGDKGGFPIDIALSHDATKLAVDMIDVSQGGVNTTISFYNFGSVGQSQIDNNVGTYTYKGILIPEIDYLSDTKMLALGTGKILVFDGAQKPELTQEILLEQDILSYFHNDKYVGIVYDSIEMENSWHVKVMDLKGNVVMENDISISYDKVEFLSNNEICVTNESECEIFTIHSIKKFSYTFEKPIYKIISGDSGQNYTFIFKETTEEVKLK